MDILHQIYYDPKQGFRNLNDLYKKANKIDGSITKSMVNEFLNMQATHQITRPYTKKQIHYSSIVSPNIRNNFQMDIMYLPDSRTFKYALTCIDVNSRYAFARIMKTKTGSEVFASAKDIFDESGHPANLNVDVGSEFIYKPFTKYCADNDITIWYADPDETNKNSIIERLHRTLRNMILKFIVSNATTYIPFFQDIIYNYNHSYHRTIQHSPAEVWAGEEANEQITERAEYDFNVGDPVRHVIKRNTFDKASSQHVYTKTVYSINKIKGQKYYLNGIEKPFKGYELIHAVGHSVSREYDLKIKNFKKQSKIQKVLKALEY